ncbi:hypothetical protein BSKO_07098 [Bryopsis sp. KO-2023]|nr:hypothetical protein BSKO_07098 [Bryopsis sp. KO-2023]
MSGRGGGGGRGRGWYYKEKYGGGRGGGRGRGGGGGGGREGGGEKSKKRKLSVDHDGFYDQRGGAPPQNDDYSSQGEASATIVGNSDDLMYRLRSIDGKGYGAYKDLWGGWQFKQFILFMDHIQGDAYAAPSRVRVQIPQNMAGFPPELYSTKIRNIALCDYMTRRFGSVVRSAGADVRTQSGGWGGAKGGEMSVDQPGQHVIERSSVNITSEYVDVRFTVGLPARGRTVLGEWAHKMLIENLPKYIYDGMTYGRQNENLLRAHILCCEDSEALRSQLAQHGLVGFVGNGSILPRKSGACDEPMSKEEAVPFAAPPSLEIELKTPNRGAVKGLGIRKGVTLIVGGGFHGKSTLLNALEVGVYNKIAGDGRELVVADPNSVKIRSEDGRHVECVDISPFLNNLPYGKDTVNFRSADASGSTSQAANIQESLEVGATTMLVDEDTCATNFMIRDQRMQALVAKEKEPITPFIARIRGLVDVGVSTVLVIGGSGDYFDVADTVVCMDSFIPRDVTAEAKKIANEIGVSSAAAYAGVPYGNVPRRSPTSVYSEAPKISVRNATTISFGDELQLDLAGVEQLVEISQTRAISDTLRYIKSQVEGGKFRGRSMAEIADQIDREMDAQGMDAVASFRKAGNLARPRRFEIIAALNRLRSVRMQPCKN